MQIQHRAVDGHICPDADECLGVNRICTAYQPRPSHALRADGYYKWKSIEYHLLSDLVCPLYISVMYEICDVT